MGSVLSWLRAGYPKGIPRGDYVALFAVLHRRLTEVEIVRVAEQLTADKSLIDGTEPIEREQIEHAISRLAKERPGDDDVARVEARLTAGGWPVAGPAEG